MFKKLLLTSALLATFSNAHAQQSQTVGMTGSIPPGACTVTLGANAAISLGALRQSAVRQNAIFPGKSAAVYATPVGNLAFTVNCTAVTKVALGFTDNNAGKNLRQGDTDDIYKFGVVDSTSGTSIGNFQFYFSDVFLDGKRPGMFFSAPISTTPAWVTNNVLGGSQSAQQTAPGNMNGFGNSSASLSPDGIQKMTGMVMITLSLGKAVIDTMTTALTPTGSATLTLIYL